MRSFVGVVSIAVWVAALLVTIFDPTPTTGAVTIWHNIAYIVGWIYQIASLLVFIGLVWDGPLSETTLPNKVTVGSWVVFFISAMMEMALNPVTSTAASPGIIVCLAFYVVIGYLVIAILDWMINKSDFNLNDI